MISYHLPKYGADIAAGLIALVGAFVMTASADLAASPLIQAILREYGPIGIAVYMLWWRLDRLEERVDKNKERINRNHDD